LGVYSVGVLAVLLIMASAAAAPPSYPPPTLDARPFVSKANWRVYAVEYARSKGVATKRLVAGGAPKGQVDMSWHFYVAVGHGRVVMVDAGSDHFAKKGYLTPKWSIARSRTVVASLAQLGLKPVEVTDVVLTHFHWDHVGGVASLPKARVHMLPKEWARVSKNLRGPVEAGKRYVGTGSLPPGFLVTEAGRHTRHHAIVEVACVPKPIVVAGDGIYLWDNLRLKRPVSQNTDPKRSVREMQAVAKRVGQARVIPGHDPAVFTRYPSGVDGVALICR